MLQVGMCSHFRSLLSMSARQAGWPPTHRSSSLLWSDARAGGGRVFPACAVGSVEMLAVNVLFVIGAIGRHTATNLRDQRSPSAIRCRRPRLSAPRPGRRAPTASSTPPPRCAEHLELATMHVRSRYERIRAALGTRIGDRRLRWIRRRGGLTVPPITTAFPTTTSRDRRGRLIVA